ncbi:nuclear transport factor 2 family protein [Acetobacteraceae bacterium H6797]|nr:nuclear transport factor 2 family protein [Acetobacteraceae bacterium H6797]
MSSPDATSILALEDRRFRALEANDLGTLDRLTAEELRHVHSNGTVEDKGAFLGQLRNGTRRYREYRALTREARQEGGFTFVFGEAAVTIERTGAGPEEAARGVIATRMTYTAIYRHHPMPQLFAWHSVKSPTPPSPSPGQP